MKSSLLLFLFSATVPLRAAPTPAGTSSRRAGDVIPGRFIVQLAPGASSETITAHHQQVQRMLRRKRGETGGGNGPAGIRRVFSFGDFYSYSAGLDDLTAADIARLPGVRSVEPDVVVRLEPSVPEAAPDAGRRRALETQANSPWHLGDISHKAPGATEYVYDDRAGEGTTIYVVDSGIRASHVEFEGRVRYGINGWTNSTKPPPPNRIDTTGHGTHVASIAAGKTYGVAKKAHLVDCIVFDGDNATKEAMLTSLTWAVQDILDRKAEKTSVLNLSLGIAIHWSGVVAAKIMDDIVIAAYKKGIVSVVAAGNSNKPATGVSPAHLKEAITVGWTERNRRREHRSNYGPALDIFAPGDGIVAAGATSDSRLTTKSGTSMATPIVSGLVAYLRSIESGLDTPEQVRARLIELSLKDVVENAKGSPNRLLYNGSGR